MFKFSRKRNKSLINTFMGAISLAIVLGFSGCSGSGDSTTENGNNATGIAQLGYISGGNVKLFELTNLNTPIATTTSSKSIVNSEAGRFTFKNVELNSSNYYLVEISGGQDIDPNDDGEIGADKAVDLNGSVYSLAKGEELIDGNVRINALSDIAYQKIKGNLSTLTDSEIDTKLADNAREYLYDINGDGKIDNKDILAFDPTKDRDKTKKSYRDILDIYVSQLHNGASEAKKLSALMYLDKPRIMIKNGALQEVPFTLEASIENVPQSASVKWSLNDVNKSNIKETISEDGIYIVAAKIYKDSNLVKTITTQVVATKKVEIASIDVDITKENSVFVTDESNSSLAGAEIIIPKGALKKNTTITVKKSSVNSIPNTDGIGISDVIALEPSGLTFDKPVQIRIPYNDNIDLENMSVRIARYSKGGEIDYIEPLFIDTDTHEVVFETEHFTEFELQTYYGFTQDKVNQTEIQEIQKLTGFTSYNNDKWKEILNTNVINDNTTVYDLYLKYKLHKNIVQKMKDKDYKGAYDLFLKNEVQSNNTGEMWRKIGDIYEGGLDTYGTYTQVRDNMKAIFITKKYFSQIASDLGVVTDMNPMSFVTDYTTYVFNQGIQIIKKADKINKKDAFSLFHKFREENQDTYSFKEILEELKKSTRDEGYKSRMLFDNPSYPMSNGWLGNNYYSSGTLSFQSSKQYYYSLNAIWEIKENFNKKTDQEHINALKNIILTIGNNLDLNEAKKSKSISAIELLSSSFHYYDKDKDITLNPIIRLRGYQSDINFKIMITDINNKKLSDFIDFNCIIDDKTDSIYRECTNSLTFNSSILKVVDGKSLIKLRLYDDDYVYPDYLDKEVYVNLKRNTVKKQIDVQNITINARDNLGDNPEQYIADVVVNLNEQVPYDIEVKLDGEVINNDKTIYIPNSEFDNVNLSNLEIAVKPKSSLGDNYIFPTTTHIKSVKEDIDKIKANEEIVSSVPVLKIIKINGNPVSNNEATLVIGDSVTYNISGGGLEQILSRTGLKGDCEDGIEGNEANLTCTYNSTLTKFAPTLKVEANSGSVSYPKAPEIEVTQEDNIAPVITTTTDETIYTKGQKIYLKASAVDNDGEVESTKWEPFMNSITIYKGDSIDQAYIYAPTITEDKTKKYMFKIIAIDDDKATSTKLYAVKVQGSATNQPPTVSLPNVPLIPNKSDTLTPIVTDEDISTLTYEWNIVWNGDNIEGALPGSGKYTSSSLAYTTPTLEVGESGNLNVTLKVTDKEGLSATTSKTYAYSIEKIEALQFVGDNFNDNDVLPRNTSKQLEWKVKNVSNVDLKDVVLSLTTKADKLTVTQISPSTISTWPKNETKTFKAEVTVPANITEGTHKQQWNFYHDTNKALPYSGKSVSAPIYFEFKTTNPNDLVGRMTIDKTIVGVGEPLTALVEITSGNEPYRLDIDWGDGNTQVLNDIVKNTSEGMTQSLNHNYSSEGSYPITVKVTDNAGEQSTFTEAIKVAENSAKTSWKANVHDISTDERETDINVNVTSKSSNGVTFGEYSTSWTPTKDAQSKEYFIKYRLPIPPKLIMLDRKMRVTVKGQSSDIQAYDREINFRTSDSKEYTASIRYKDYEETLADGTVIKGGYFTTKDIATGEVVKEKADLLNSEVILLDGFYAMGMLPDSSINVYKYDNNEYTNLLQKNISTNNNWLTELDLTFKGNGAVKLVILEYDLNDDGEFTSDEKLILNTTSKSVDWSKFTGEEADSLSVEQDSTDNAITLSANNTHGDALTYIVVTQPLHGSLSGSGQNLFYTPVTGYSGNDSFTYKVNDGNKDSEVETVNITINATQNEPPVALGIGISIHQDSIDNSITLAGEDKDGDALTYIVVTQPLHGSLSGSGQNLFYTPATGYSGNDSFIYKVNDGKADSEEASVSIGIIATQNTAPQNLAVTQQENSVLVSWDAVAGASTYNVYFSSDGETYQSVTDNNQGYDNTQTSFIFSDTDFSGYFKVKADDGEFCEPVKFTWTTQTTSASAIKKTGQIKSYNVNGTEVTDNSLKDDGYYQKGVTPDYTRASDIVTDELTGLMWQDNADVSSVTKQWLTDTNYDTCSNDTSSPSCYDTSGDTAATYCSDLTLGGYTDWRLPTRKELEGIVDYSKVNPAISSVFTNTSSSYYWSSTTYEGYKSGAWYVNFDDGRVYGNGNKDNNYYVRCVRDGQ